MYRTKHMYRTKQRITRVAIVSFILAASCRDATGPGSTSSNSTPRSASGSLLPSGFDATRRP